MNDSQFHEEPMRQKCFTRDFASMIQLFRILTEYLEFSKPFKLVIHYDPDSPRVTIETYAPIEVHERHIQQAEGQRILLSEKEDQGEVIRFDPSEVNEIELNEDEWRHAEEMMRYSIAKNPETGCTEIHPMNGKEYIEIHGVEDAKFFTDHLMDSFRKE